MLMKFKQWTLLYGVAFACALLSLVMVYYITVTGNVAYEAGIYLLVFLGFVFAAVGYILESRYKRENPEEFDYDYLEEE
jgi:hypothetical protein